MAISDFTGKNIQDTYQRVVQTDGTNLADGTGSLLPISFDGNNVIISGSLTATEYSISSSVTNIQIATLSGSTEFGNSSDDTHNFTGNITASGDISASGFIYGQEVKANSFSPLQENGHIDLGDGGGSIQAKTNITASGDISASGDINADEYISNGKSVAFSDITGLIIGNNTTNPITIGRLGLTPTFIQGQITASNNISASIAGKLQNFTQIEPASGNNILISPFGAAQPTSDHLLTVGGSIKSHNSAGLGFVSLREGNITASGNISSSGVMISNKYEFGEGGSNAYLEKSGESNLTIKFGNSDFNGHITASGNISASGEIIGTINGGTF